MEIALLEAAVLRNPLMYQRFILDKSIPEPNTGCRLWLGGVGGRGIHQYGVQTIIEFRTNMTAHKVSYLAFKGPMPKGTEAGHKCHVKLCVEAEHVIPLSHQENMEDTCRTRQTHCKWGHPLSGDNLYTTPDNRRQCRECLKEAKRRLEYRRNLLGG